MRHSTILVDIDTSELWKVLNFDHDSYVCKSVPSVKSDIINLKMIKPNLTVRNVITALSEGKESYEHINVNNDSLTHYQSS
jgi:lipoate-protein ligase A